MFSMRKGLPREGYGGEILEPPYRGLVSCEGLFPTRVLYKESDLFILAERNLKRKALKSLLRARASIEEYIKRIILEDIGMGTNFLPRMVLSNTNLILDNMGIWSDLELPKTIEYHEAGDANWLR